MMFKFVQKNGSSYWKEFHKIVAMTAHPCAQERKFRDAVCSAILKVDISTPPHATIFLETIAMSLEIASSGAIYSDSSVNLLRGINSYIKKGIK